MFNFFKRKKKPEEPAVVETVEEKSLPEEAGKLLVVDGLFSMEGDVAPLPEIIQLTKPAGVRLMVDDAHGIGVLGKSGRGALEDAEI